MGTSRTSCQSRSSHQFQPPSGCELSQRYRTVRDLTLRLCDPLSSEDMTVQAHACASPTKWHLAHTTWFFETFILREYEANFQPYCEEFSVLFNSYYKGIGPQHPRAWRGVLTRPGIGEVMAYRDAVDDRICSLLDHVSSDERFAQIASLLILGLHHEQQHQELLLTDIKLLFHTIPQHPAYRSDLAAPMPSSATSEMHWVAFEEGVVEIGHEGSGFSYDNEGPRHRRFLEPFELASRPVSNAEYLRFVEDNGYQRHELWLDDGWTWAAQGHAHPPYWHRLDDRTWIEFTLGGERPLDLHAPVSHLSFFEADAYARWAGARLPTEAEWEHAASDQPLEGNLLESHRLHPSRSEISFQTHAIQLAQCFGDVWEWTRSAHEPYPGYAPPPGAIGEYNGKFMCGSFVLRGGSCLTSLSHLRSTYRNFLHPSARWQCSGLRLARSQH